MDLLADDSALALARDPLFLIDSRLDILWQNQAARYLIQRISTTARVDNLGDICSGLTRHLLLQTHGICSIPVTLLKSPADEIHRRYAIIFEVSGAEPNELRYLVGLQASAPPSRQEPTESFATVAHDLKNPLSAIFGYTDALLDSPSSSSLGKRERDVIGRVRGTAARAIEMVRNFQQLAELESKPLTRRSARNDLSTHVRAAIEHTWRDEANSPTLTVTLCPEPIPLAIESVQLERIVSNLFINALRYTPPGGAIELITAVKNGEATLVVQNSGSYIPPAEISKIFDRYERGSTSRGTVGSGLGLYIVRQLVDAAKGQVECRSYKGVTPAQDSTQFMVRFPIAHSL